MVHCLPVTNGAGAPSIDERLSRQGYLMEMNSDCLVRQVPTDRPARWRSIVGLKVARQALVGLDRVGSDQQGLGGQSLCRARPGAKRASRATGVTEHAAAEQPAQVGAAARDVAVAQGSRATRPMVSVDVQRPDKQG